LFCKNFVIAFPRPLLWHANKNRSPAGVFNENSKDIIQFNNGFKPIGPHVLRTRVRLVTIFLWCVQKPSLGGYGGGGDGGATDGGGGGGCSGGGGGGGRT